MPRLPNRGSTPGQPLVGKNDNAKNGIFSNVNTGESFCTSLLADPEIVDCLAVLEDEECCFLPFEYKGESPLDLEKIREEQLNDADLQDRIQRLPEVFVQKILGKYKQVTCYVKPGDDPLRQWKVYLPDSMLKDTVHWFHLALGHPGASRLKALISASYCNPRLHSVIQKY